jgi:hypothetical protein
MKNENKLTEFENLIEEGKKLLEDHGWDGSVYKKDIRDEVYSSFLHRSLYKVKEIFKGEDNPFYEGLKRIAEDPKKSSNSYYFFECYGILEGAFKTYKNQCKTS